MREDPNHPIKDWRYEVANDVTKLGYDDWLESKTAQDCDLLQFRVRIVATVRASDTTTIYARNYGNAIEQARKIDPNYLSLTVEEDVDIEGDEIALVASVEVPMADEVEVDLRKAGEPFSWDACEIVKDLAKLHGRFTSFGELSALINRAQAACKQAGD